jgi:hypothetical protein
MISERGRASHASGCLLIFIKSESQSTKGINHKEERLSPLSPKEEKTDWRELRRREVKGLSLGNKTSHSQSFSLH